MVLIDGVVAILIVVVALLLITVAVAVKIIITLSFLNVVQPDIIYLVIL